MKKYCETANKDFWGLKTDLDTLAVGEVGSLEDTYVAAGSKFMNRLFCEFLKSIYNFYRLKPVKTDLYQLSTS